MFRLVHQVIEEFTFLELAPVPAAWICRGSANLNATLRCQLVAVVDAVGRSPKPTWKYFRGANDPGKVSGDLHCCKKISHVLAIT